MKIKEKGLPGRTKKAPPTRKGFNAFNLKETGKERAKKPEPQEKPEIFLEFMGKRLKVNQEDGGSVVETDVPFTKGASLKFSGCGGDVRFAEIKVCFIRFYHLYA
jgi:lupus La protein